MTVELDEVLGRQHVYVPRGTVHDTLTLGKQLGFAAAQRQNTHLTVVCADKSGLANHRDLARQTLVTERGGYVRDGGVVLAWCPTYRVMDKVNRLQNSTIVLVEWIPGEFSNWAKLVGAYNAVSREVMDAPLSDETSKALEGISRQGYNGWTNDIDITLVNSRLRDLRAAGTYDRELILAHARQSRSDHGLRRLAKILDKFEVSRPEPLERASHRDRWSQEW